MNLTHHLRKKSLNKQKNVPKNMGKNPILPILIYSVNRTVRLRCRFRQFTTCCRFFVVIMVKVSVCLLLIC